MPPGDEAVIEPAEGNRYLPSVGALESTMRAGNSALAAGDMDRALRYFNEALRLKPRYDVAWTARAHTLERMGDLEGALKSFAEAAVIRPSGMDVWTALASILHRMGRHREELEADEELLRHEPLSVEAMVNRAAALHELRRFDEAAAACDAALAIRPEYAPAWNNRGAALMRKGRLEEALHSFDEALAFEPAYFDALVNRTFALQKLGRHGEAVMAIDRALRLRETGWLHYLRGLSHLALYESTAATRSFERSLALEPKLREAREALRRAGSVQARADFDRGVYECFGTFESSDPGCAECEIQARCREVTP